MYASTRKLMLFFLVVLFAFPFSVSIAAQSRISSKRIAITIDDLPLNGPDIRLELMQAMTNRWTSAIKQNNIPVVGFVNEARLFVPGETDERIALLKAWLDAGAELGNHTHSHLGFKGTPLMSYEDDFVRGDTITRGLMKQVSREERYFRHPFLQMGDTLELENAFEDFIAKRGYRIAPATVDTMDWLILSAYEKYRNERDPRRMKQVSDDYLKYLDAKLDYCERASLNLFGRPISHILLMHVNKLNADNFDRFIDFFKRRGYQFVTLEEALSDPVYVAPGRYVATSDWLANWAVNKGVKYEPPMPPAYIVKIYEQGQKK